MAIKLPDPGNGIPEQKTGNDEWTNMQIVRENFADQSNAASRLVGTANGNVAEITSRGVAGTGWGGTYAESINTPEVRKSLNTSGVYRIDHDNSGLGGTFSPLLFVATQDTFYTLAVNYSSGNVDVVYGTKNSVLRGDEIPENRKMTIYTTKNTTKDVATGFLKASSPVLHVYNDSITKIHEAEQLDIVVDKKGVGHYEIHGTTGLRKNDGWFMSPPRDMHSNVLCMVDFEEKDGVVILKTYKKKFDFETVSIVHDYDNPMDIPEGSCVEFRFNDLPEEQLDEPIE